MRCGESAQTRKVGLVEATCGKKEGEDDQGVKSLSIKQVNNYIAFI
jgi:hypothetical protein